jgi:hypothetical protein
LSLYAYCLGDELSAGAVEGVSGVGGARVRVLSLGRIAAVVSDLEDEGLTVTRENVTAHNRVNARVLARVTPLPFRFGTRVAEAELAGYVAANEAALLASLARVRGCVEMGVKIRAGEKAKVKGQKTKEGDEAAAGEEAARVGRGTAFLLAKRREILGDEALMVRAEELAAWLADRLSDLVRETDARLSPSESLVVRAAHLVGRERVAEYQERVRAMGGERGGLQFLTSGPWPPYSFSRIGGR